MNSPEQKMSEQKSGQRVRFQWNDPLFLAQLLSEDERMIRDTAQAYAQDKLAPRVRAWASARVKNSMTRANADCAKCSARCRSCSN